MSEIPEGLVHRDTIIAGPGQTHRILMPPWVEFARAIVKGADAAKPDGSPGDSGYAIVELYGKPEDEAS